MNRNMVWVLTAMNWSLGVVAVAQSLPLQSRTYRAGSRYIEIVTKAGRTCYHGFSARGAIVASVVPDPQHEGFYLVNGLDNFVLHQQDTKTLLAGSMDRLIPIEADYSIPASMSDTVQECLNSNEAFYNQVDGGRGSR